MKRLFKKLGFTLDGSGDLSVWLRGGTGSGSLAGQPESVVPAASTAPGFQGVALRDAATGVFVLSGRKAANGDHWENIVFSAAQLAALDQGATYTLDLIDAGHGGWGWATMDTVSISYSSVPPWPQFAAGAGVSLQLIDSSQGAHHIGNWASSASTPGHSNSVARPLPLFPNFHINEIQTLNLTGPLDPTGSRGPWVELYHDDQVALSPDGFFLSDDPTDLTKWPFPSAAAMPAASFRMVWLDGRDHLTTADNWHSGFLLTAPADTLTLSRIVDGVPLVISHRAFPVLPGNTSYGPWPDGSQETFLFPVATPGAPNANPSPQVAEVVMPRFMQGAVPNTGRVRCRPRRCHRRARRGRVEPRRLRAAGGRPPVRPAGRRHRGRVRTLGH